MSVHAVSHAPTPTPHVATPKPAAQNNDKAQSTPPADTGHKVNIKV